jgi:hypothetical protein
MRNPSSKVSCSWWPSCLGTSQTLMTSWRTNSSTSLELRLLNGKSRIITINTREAISASVAYARQREYLLIGTSLLLIRCSHAYLIHQTISNPSSAPFPFSPRGAEPWYVSSDLALGLNVFFGFSHVIYLLYFVRVTCRADRIPEYLRKNCVPIRHQDPNTGIEPANIATLPYLEFGYGY